MPTIAGYHDGDGSDIYGYTDGAYPAVEGTHGGSGSAVAGYALVDSIGVVGVQTTYSPGDTGLWRPGGLFGVRNGVIGISKANGGFGVYGQNQSVSGDYSVGVYGESRSPSGDLADPGGVVAAGGHRPGCERIGFPAPANRWRRQWTVCRLLGRKRAVQGLPVAGGAERAIVGRRHTLPGQNFTPAWGKRPTLSFL